MNAAEMGCKSVNWTELSRYHVTGELLHHETGSHFG